MNWSGYSLRGGRRQRLEQRLRAGEDFQYCAVGQFGERRLPCFRPGHALDFPFRQSATYLAADPRQVIAGVAALPTVGRAGGSVSNDRFRVIAIGSDGGRSRRIRK